MNTTLRSLILLSFLANWYSPASAKNVVIPADKNGYTAGARLKPNSTYAAVPDPTSEWSWAKGQKCGYLGDPLMIKTKFAGEQKVGALVMAVFHRRGDGKKPIAKAYEFEPGKLHAVITTGEHGADVYFRCADTAYGDNKGHLIVRLEKDDGTGKAFRPMLPTTKKDGSATWTVGANGSLDCRIGFTVGAGPGKKTYTSVLTAEFSDGTPPYVQTATVTRVRPASGTETGHKKFKKPSIPANKLNKVSYIYVETFVDKGPSTVKEYVEHFEEMYHEADKKYRDFKKSEIYKDAVKALAPS